MANNFKSKEVFWNTGATKLLLSCSTSSAIVSSITYQGTQSSGGDATLKFYKNGSTLRDVSIKKSIGSATTEFLTKSWVLENGDQFQMTVGNLSETAVVTIHYMEKTASVATSDTSDLSDVTSDAPQNGQILVFNSTLGKYEPVSISSGLGSAVDTGDLPEETTGTEPLNRYMKNIGGLDDLSSGGASSAATLYGDAAKSMFVVEHDDENVVQKVSFADIIAAIIQVGSNDIVAGGYADVSVFTGPTGVYGDLDGNGAVGTADLLAFLTTFGNTWGQTSSLFSSSRIIVNDPTGYTRTLYEDTTIQMVLPSSSYVTVIQGTQTVVVDYTNELISIESASSEVPISAWTNMKVVFTGSLGCTVAVVDDSVNVELRYTLYDSSGTSLGNGANLLIYNYPVAEAGTDQSVPIDFILDSPTLETNTVITGGWTNADIDKIEFSFYANTLNTLPGSFWFEGLNIDMSINQV